MPKGKPWTVEEERQLRRLREEGRSCREIASIMKKTEQAIMKKLQRSGLKVVQLRKSIETTSEELIVPKELISIEEALLELTAAMTALKKPNISKTEVMRLKALVQTSGLYQKRLADYIDYRRLEVKVIDLTDKYEQLTRQT
jgi:IS30 family transposase